MSRAFRPATACGWHNVSMRVRDFSEDELLGLIRPHLPGAEGIEVASGDDCAVIGLSAGNVAISTDMLVEGSHYLPEWSTGYDVGWRAAMQNAADAAAMGARPVSFVAALSVPGDRDVEWLVEFARGMGEAARRVGAGVDGGDLTRGPATAGVTVVGDLSGRPPALRSGARPGDRLIHCGVLGWSVAGLHFLTNGAVAPECASVLPAGSERSPAPNGHAPDGADAVVAVYKRPNPPVDLALAACAAGQLGALMDVSDGLVRDAWRMAEASNVGIDIDPAAIARDVDGLVCAGVRRELAEGMVLGGGEDHGFLATTSNSVPEGWRQIGAVREPCPGGKRESGGFVTYDGRDIPKATGWDHFRAERV